MKKTREHRGRKKPIQETKQRIKGVKQMLVDGCEECGTALLSRHIRPTV